MIEYILLGIVQGFTEFLPVSSSGHLMIAQRVLGLNGEEIALAVVLHLGTLIAVVIFFSKDIIKLFRDLRSLSLVLVAALITGVIGFFGKGFFENLFISPVMLAPSFIFTGALLLLTRKFMEAKREKVSLKDAIILGFTQATAIIPGISRSGMTISTLLFRKIDREACFKFSFLVSIPVILGAAVLEARKVDFALKNNFAHLAVGFFSSLFAGLAALWILKSVIRHAKFHYFGYYCIVMGVAVIFFLK